MLGGNAPSFGGGLIQTDGGGGPRFLGPPIHPVLTALALGGHAPQFLGPPVGKGGGPRFLGPPIHPPPVHPLVGWIAHLLSQYQPHF